MRANRYVLDANIWISYFITQHEQYLASIIFDNELTVYFCDELLEEIKRVSGYSHLKKYNLKWEKVEDFIQMSSVHF